MKFPTDRYEIRRELGHGGYGVVYLAYDLELRRDCVIKTLDLGSPKAAAASESLMHEHEILRLLASRKTNHAENHGQNSKQNGTFRSVVEVYEFYHQPVPMLVEEYVEGETLRAHLAAHLLLQQKAALLIQLAHALATIHSNGIVYCDLTPANVMVRPNGTVTLIDFGLARLNSALQHPSLHDEIATKIRGTVEYMSPEQFRGESLDQRSDLYSLGTLYYEILTGRVPYCDGTAEDIRAGHLFGYAPSVSDVSREIPWALSRIVGVLMQRQRYLRYRNAADVAQRLQTVVRSIGDEASFIRESGMVER